MPEQSPPQAEISVSDSVGVAVRDTGVTAVDIRVIQEPSPPPATEDLARQELQLFESSKRELILKDLKNEIEARRTYAVRLFWLMIGWIAAMVALVLADALTI